MKHRYIAKFDMIIYLPYNLLGNLNSKEAKNSMITFIKTAIITIVISIISGLLLERCKNFGPKILCDIGKARILDLGNKKVYAYVITVSNLSNKTIHELTLNIHGSNSAIKFDDAKITKGLKFDSLIEDNVLDIFMPYLSKDDEFSITVYLENSSKPVIAMRSPENFKQIDSKKQGGFLMSLFDGSKNKNSKSSNKVIKNDRTIYNEENDYTMVMNKVSGNEKINEIEGTNNKNKKLSKNKKIMIAVGSIVVLVIAGVLVKFGFKEATASKQITPVKTDIHKSSNDSRESEEKTTKNVDNKKSTGGTVKNSESKTSAGEGNKSTESKASIGESTKNIDNKASTGETNKNTDTKPADGDATKSVDTKATTEDKTKNTDTKPSTGDSTKNSNTNTSTSGETKTTETKPTTSESTKSTDTKATTSGTTENKNN